MARRENCSWSLKWSSLLASLAFISVANGAILTSGGPSTETTDDVVIDVDVDDADLGQDEVPLPSQEPTCRVDPNKDRFLMLVSTMDGKVSALNIAKGGSVEWSVDAGSAPLLSSSISYLEIKRDGVPTRLIPSLDGALFQFDGDVIEPLPFTADSLLSSTFRFQEDSMVVGGKGSETYGIDTKTGKTVEEQKDKIVTLETNTKRLKERLDETQKKSKALEKELFSFKETMEEKFNDVERRSRDYSIRIRGVPAAVVTTQNDHRITVAAILVENNLVGGATAEVAKNAMEIAHPLGKPVNGKYNLIARFHSRPFRNNVARAAKRLGGNLKGAERITEDLTKLDSDRKRLAFPQMQTAFREGHKVKFHKGKLVIDGEIVEINK